ncbi:hypothetical protein [Caballeronia sp. GAWG1-1]|uniref:hypothetical protein n=1 Tax=Caballeronia sp. GAWG1-1 TaxID=2921742 RepID=UPI00202989C6|nr:hypothetical protein [Caballeronia sp. GAWG1-1]
MPGPASTLRTARRRRNEPHAVLSRIREHVLLGTSIGLPVHAIHRIVSIDVQRASYRLVAALQIHAFAFAQRE